jgi:hypothetical protein
MSDWIASISAQDRRWVSPSPRCISFYPDALVIARGPSLWWQRFKAGAGAGSDSPFIDAHVVDDAQLSANLNRVNADAAQTMFETSRNATAGELAAMDPKNVLIPMNEVAGIHATGMHPHAKLIITRTDGSAVRLYCRATGPAFQARLNILRSVLGDRFSTEKITG